jgi:hypothetical protein
MDRKLYDEITFQDVAEPFDDYQKAEMIHRFVIPHRFYGVRIVPVVPKDYHHLFRFRF